MKPYCRNILGYAGLDVGDNVPPDLGFAIYPFRVIHKYEEAQSAETSKDFIHKIKIALKELRESIIEESDELTAILFKSVDTAKKKYGAIAIIYLNIGYWKKG